jgi:hypothetical protein
MNNTTENQEKLNDGTIASDKELYGTESTDSKGEVYAPIADNEEATTETGEAQEVYELLDENEHSLNEEQNLSDEEDEDPTEDESTKATGSPQI